MKRVMIMGVIAVSLAATHAFTAPIHAVPQSATVAGPASMQDFAAGNAAYEAGDYSAAIDRYMVVANAGIVHADLFYNLGNAYFKSGDLGHAILWYERTLRLEPRSDDVRANLAVVRSMVRDQQLLPAHGGVRGVILAWHRWLSATESAAVACVCYGLFTVAGLCLIFRRTRFVSSFYRRASWVSPGRLFGLSMAQDIWLGMATTVALAIVFAGSAYTKIRDESTHARSVVINEEVAVFSGPSPDATIQFKIHEGTIVAVRDGRPGWIRVDLPGDLSGWVETGTVEKI